MTETTKEPEDKLARARDQAGAQYESIVKMVEDYQLAEAVDISDDIDPEEHEDALRRLFFDESVYYELRHTTADDPRVFWAEKNSTTDEDDETETFDTEAEAMFACCKANDLLPSAEEARQRIEEDALSVQVRSDWHNPGEAGEDAEFEILLCTGGPAVRILGDLDRGSPTRAWMECQDWFLPWTEVFAYGKSETDPGSFAHRIDQNTLLTFASVFYFGD